MNKCEVKIAIGTYEVTDQARFQVSRNDTGTSISFTNEVSGQRYAVRVDESGAVTLREHGPIDPKSARPTGEPTAPPSLSARLLTQRLVDSHRSARGQRLTARTPTKLKFRFHPNAADRARKNRAFVFAGYRCGTNLVVLCRIYGKTGTRDELMRIIRGNRGVLLRTLGKAMRAEAKLADSDWDRFLNLAVGTGFKLEGRTWIKCSADEVAHLDGQLVRPVPCIGDASDLGYGDISPGSM